MKLFPICNEGMKSLFQIIIETINNYLRIENLIKVNYLLLLSDSKYFCYSNLLKFNFQINFAFQ
jgi:hypothetical protein